MGRKKWLITGASGLLGANFSIELAKKDEVIGVSRRAPANPLISFVQGDISDAAFTEGLLKSYLPDIIVHCAALSTHEECERNPELAHAVNVETSRQLARQAFSSGAKFVYISTDAVFDGALGNYSEQDQPSPRTTYGRTKLAGEIAVLEENPEALVLRVNFYGWSPSGTRSIAEYFFNNFELNRKTPGFTDVKVSTTYVGCIIEPLQRLISLNVTGILNLATSEPITKFELGKSIAKRLGMDPGLVERKKAADILNIHRGADTSLNTSKLESLIGSIGGQELGVDALIRARTPELIENLRSFRP